MGGSSRQAVARDPIGPPSEHQRGILLSSSPQPDGIPAGLIVETDAMAEAGVLRREPYLALFPLGAALGCAGVLHWLLHALGVLEDFRPVFHTTTQVQGFLTSFALGFLMTMIPRRTGSAPPSTTELGIALAMPPITVAFAWGQHVAAAQISWLVLAAMVIAFAVRRFLSSTSKRRPPNAFVWIPLAFLFGISGSVALLAAPRLGPRGDALELFGRGLLQQGMFLALVLGVGSLALPLMTRGEAPADAEATGRDRLIRTGNVFAAALLAASFWIGTQYSLRLGFLLRAAVVLAVLLGTARIWKAPREGAWNARSIWLAAWVMPTGYLVAAAFPTVFRVGLHLTFLGGFSLLALAVSTQVVLGHGGRSDLMFGKPAAVAAIAILLLAAVAPRALMELDPQRYFLWMGVASFLFLSAVAAWAAFLVPKLVARARDDPGPADEPG